MLAKVYADRAFYGLTINLYTVVHLLISPLFLFSKTDVYQAIHILFYMFVLYNT